MGSPIEERVMPNLNPAEGSSQTPQRRYRRFRLRYPVNVRFELENRGSELRALSNNLS
jgi:hypothetical protein